MISTPTIRLLLPCPKWREGEAWGDYYFGHSLGSALERLGCTVKYSYSSRRLFRRLFTFLQRAFNRREVELVLRGKKVWTPLPGKRALIWVISNSESIRAAELRSFSHAFIASEVFLDRLGGSLKSSSLLLQCTDGTRFGPRSAPGDSPSLFVGNRRNEAPRKIVKAAIAAGHSVQVWGRGWPDDLLPGGIAGRHIENHRLPDFYKSASVVLNDHTPAMLADGFVSNRVFDVAACATPLITEEMPGIPPEFRSHLFLYSSLDEVKETMRAALSSTAEKETARVALARTVLQSHTFDQRAEEILKFAALPAPQG